MATGAGSGVFVLDVDTKDGKDSPGELRKLEAEHGPLPETTTWRTLSGGLQLAFQHPGGYVKGSVDELAVGLDIHGDGNYVLVPPSVGYEYVVRAAPAEAPNWLLELIRERRPTQVRRERRSLGENFLYGREDVRGVA